MSKKRRKFTAQFKFETVMEGLRVEKSIAQLCRERNITESLYYKWRDHFLEQAPQVFEGKGQTDAEERARQIGELEQIIGQLTVENTILKKAKSLLGSNWR